jgi:NAD(P)-dependent dehydrogenase (short-subunit alcohol dehydrogenase family)
MALLFAQNGASIVVNGNNEERGNAVAEEIQAMGGKAVFIKASVASREDAQALAQKTVEQYGKIDVLINNAGINIDMKDRGPIHEFRMKYGKRS